METRNKPPGTDVGGARPESASAPRNDPDQLREDVKRAGETVRDQARATGDQIKNTASDAGRQAKEKAGQVAEQAQRKAAEYARQAQSQGVAMLDQQKSRAAEQINTFSDAAHRAADKFREEQDDNIAGYIDAAADEVQRVGEYLRERDLNTLWRDAQSFGRRRPEWFLGGMFVAGLALTRFLKASAERREQPDMRGYQGYRGVPRYMDEPDYAHRLPSPPQATRQFDSVADGATGVGAMATSPATLGTLGTTATAGSSGSPGGASPSLASDPTSPGSPASPGVATTKPEVY
ncbi:MAG TPA: hypothetical protein VGN72_04780 [Tepidisphaeraceae bacterium]|jgi:hypothetical protein|nr:hypothetical protein [Tepidisphaeraceae bacterium]